MQQRNARALACLMAVESPGEPKCAALVAAKLTGQQPPASVSQTSSKETISTPRSIKCSVMPPTLSGFSTGANEKALNNIDCARGEMPTFGDIASTSTNRSL